MHFFNLAVRVENETKKNTKKHTFNGRVAAALPSRKFHKQNSVRFLTFTKNI